MDRKRWFWTLAVLLVTGFLFGNSMTPAVESSRQSGHVLASALAWLKMLGLDGEWLTEHLIRKTAHFMEYALYGAVLWNCLEAYELRQLLKGITLAWLGTMVPLMDETIQLFTEGRSGQLSDVWLDMAGFWAGCVGMSALMLLYHRLWRGRKKKRT